MKRYRTFQIMAVALIVGLTAACSQDSSRVSDEVAKNQKDEDKAFIRVVHAIPDVPVVDAYTGKNKTFTRVAYKTVTPYQEISEDDDVIAIKPAGDGSERSLVEESEWLSAGKHYTAIAMPGDGSEAKLQVIRDEEDPPKDGKARLRIVHASPDAEEIDFYRKDTKDPLFEDLSFNGDTDYIEIEPGATELYLKPAGKPDAKSLLTVPGMNFEPNKNYTLIVMGKAKGEPRLEAVLAEERALRKLARR